MPAKFRVDCIRKDEKAQHPHHVITHIGGPKTDGTRWELTIEQAIAGVRSGELELHTDEEGHRAKVYCHRSPSVKDAYYLTTSPDGVLPDNLLHLADCSQKKPR